MGLGVEDYSTKMGAPPTPDLLIPAAFQVVVKVLPFPGFSISSGDFNIDTILANRVFPAGYNTRLVYRRAAAPFQKGAHKSLL